MRWLSRVRRRTAWLSALRAAAFVPLCLAGAGVTLWVAGPLWASELRLVTVGFVAVVVSVPFLVAATHWARFRGVRVVALLERYLGSRLLSAHEFANTEEQTPLMRAHASSVAEELESLKPEQLFPLRLASQWPRLVVAFFSVVAIVALLASVRGRAALYGVIRDDVTPGVTGSSAQPAGARGVTRADLLDAVDAVVHPSPYLKLAPYEVSRAGTFEVPEFSSVELRVSAIVGLASLRAKCGTRDLVVSKGATDKSFVVRLTASSTCELTFETEHRGRPLRDRAARTMRVRKDPVAVASLAALSPTQIKRSDTPVGFAYVASDEHQLSRAVFVVRTVSGRLVNRSLLTAPGSLESRVQGELSFLPLSVGAAAGDTLAVWVEASDDAPRGAAKAESSEKLAITIWAPWMDRTTAIGEVEALLDELVDRLGDTLEVPPPDSLEGAQAGWRAREASLKQWTEHATQTVARWNARAGFASEASVLRSLVVRLTKQVEGHGQRMNPSPGSSSAVAFAALLTSEALLVETLENVVIELGDLQAKIHSRDAKLLTRELQRLQKQLSRLSAEYKRHPTEALKNELEDTMARVRLRLGELAERMRELAKDAPTDFANRDALRKQKNAAEALSEMQRSLQSGEPQSLEEAAEELRKRVESLSTAIEDANERFSQAHFDELEQRANQAASELGEMQAEQQALAEQMAEGAGARTGEAQSALSREADALSRRLGESRGGSAFSPEADTVRRAAEDMRRAAKQLREADSAGARASAESAAEKLRQAAEALGQDPGESEGGEGGTRPGERGTGSVEGGADSGEADHDRVAIPASEDQGQQTRRRLVEGMRQRAPAGYEEASRRYFEELLR